jgi:hypothetical protein
MIIVKESEHGGLEVSLTGARVPGLLEGLGRVDDREAMLRLGGLQEIVVVSPRRGEARAGQEEPAAASES